MPTSTLPSIPRFDPGPPTTENLEWADLPVVELSQTRTPEERAALATVARDAMRTFGFFYVVGHGCSPAQNERIFDIADVPFAQVPEEEKRGFVGDIKATGSYRGYKLREYWHIANGVRDQLEHYNMHRSLAEGLQKHPKALQPLIPELRAFAEFNHYEVLHPVLRLLALGMELPEDTFVKIHGFDAPGETYVRFMKYYPRSAADDAATANVYLKGHTDFGTLTVLWSQPVSALQIQTPDGRWKWVRHVPGALVVNAGDALEFLSGGFYRATIHRVVRPPADQADRVRVGAFYFAMCDDGVRLEPVRGSAALERVGVAKRFENEQAPTMEAWRRGRTSAYGQTELVKRDAGVEEEVINGVVVKHYN
ncbi:Clavaminate synthase-like protein [Epithele typhae]|uniref:Clavaminate synthase-like protein n=1 Tax=Epithele typhae TaxID=378194 RepID=UPI0020088FCF|nr:Clavaminate synthase-like protein [Epithele typhae]KAH9934537.1 Clavaminate synthase-like protein [Epithele typhae]